MSDNIKRWWHSPFRTFQTNLREIDAGLDVERVLESIEAYGADTWLVSVGGIISNYPSKLSGQRVNPALRERASGDLIGDAVQAAQRRDIRVLGRMDFSKVDAKRAERHADWCFISAQGETQLYNGYASTCPSAEYYQKVMFDVIDEVLDNYDISGFFFNWMSFNEFDYSRREWGVCHCRSCQEQFAAWAPGCKLPERAGDPHYEVWQRFTVAILDDLHSRMRSHIRRRYPDVALILGDRADITFHEANNAVGRPLWHDQTSEHVSAARSLDPNRPVFVNSVGFVDMPYRWAGEEPRHFEQYLLQAVSRGAQPSTYIMGTPEDSPFAALTAGSRITRFHRDHPEVYDGLHSAADVVVLRPGMGASQRATSEFRGVCQALSTEHVPFDVLNRRFLETVDLQRWKVLVLPDSGELSAPEQEAVQTFIERGGVGAFTGDAGWNQEGPQIQIPGVDLQEKTWDDVESLRSVHLALSEVDTAPALEFLRVLELSGSVANDHAPEGLTTHGHLTLKWPIVGPAKYGPPEKCYGHATLPSHGWVSGPLGRGVVAIAPWMPGVALHDMGLARVARHWVRQLVEVVDAPIQVRGDISAALQIVMGQSAGGHVVHLLNTSGRRSQGFCDPIPTPSGELELRLEEPPHSVLAVYQGHECAWEYLDGKLQVQVPSVDLFEVLLVRTQ